MNAQLKHSALNRQLVAGIKNSLSPSTCLEILEFSLASPGKKRLRNGKIEGERDTITFGTQSEKPAELSWG